MIFSRFTALAFALLASRCVAMPVTEYGYLQTAIRVANFQDVPHTYTSAYKFSPQCPDSIVFKELVVDGVRNIGYINITDISEDGVQCRGEDGATRMALVSEATVKQGNLLERLGFPKAYAGLKTNEAASATVRNSKSDSSLLVGFDEGTRVCGASTYSSSTFYFFIREPTQFVVTIRTGTQMQLTNVTLPPNTRALFITGEGNKLCMLADRSTGQGKTVDVRQQDATGKLVPSVTPSTSPTPSITASASASSSVAPSPSASTSVLPLTASVAPSTTAVGPSPSPTPSLSTGASPSVAPSVSVASAGNNAGGGTTPLSPSPSPTSSGGGSVCFPASARVELENGAFVPISTLKLGDRVRTGAGSFSDVFMFTHRSEHVHARFVRLVTASGASLTLTPSHYLYANGQLVAAGSVRIGDTLVLANGATSNIATIENVSGIGLYNPQTLDGNLVVDGVLTSAYTTAVHPRVAHTALLAPLRWLYAAIGAPRLLETLATAIGSHADSLAALVPSGPAALAA